MVEVQHAGVSRSETTMRCGSGWRRHILLRENCRVILSVLGSKAYRCSYSQLAERRTGTGIYRTKGCYCTNDPSTGKWKGVKSNALNRSAFVSSGRCIMLTPEDTNLPKRIQSLSLSMRHSLTEKHAPCCDACNELRVHLSIFLIRQALCISLHTGLVTD